jgi:hypothetical protein
MFLKVIGSAVPFGSKTRWVFVKATTSWKPYGGVICGVAASVVLAMVESPDEKVAGL